MREHNEYLIKVQNELTIYQQFLLDESLELTTQQAENFERIASARAWLREGFSDGQVLARMKRVFRLQERRCRELLSMAYATFGELKLSRDKEGVKAVYAEMFRQAAKRAEDAGDYRAAAALLKEAAKVDGAYDNQKVVDVESKKKPQKVTIKVRSMTINRAPETPEAPQIQDTTHEVIP